MNAPLPGVAIDTRPLDQLRATAKTAPDKALAAAARQFEAIFMQMLLKTMRESVPSSGLFDGDGGKMYTEMFDSQLAQNLSARGLGIADMLIRQLGGAAAASTAAPAGGVPAAATPSSRGTAAPPLSALEPDGAQAASEPAAESAAGARESGSVRTAQAFVEQMLPHAAAAEQSTGVPAEFILGQAALESGWGRRRLLGADGADSHNLFGVKAGPGWNGATVEAMTTEYSNGVPVKTVQKFRAYASYADAFRDYAGMLTGNPRYTEALRGNATAAGFAAGLQRGGYATDPRYADKLTRVINQALAMARS